jgi:tetratricopeptide (TPR) repeat protein
VVPHSLPNNLGLDTLSPLAIVAMQGGGVPGFFRHLSNMPSMVPILRDSLVVALVLVALFGGSLSAQELSPEERAQLEARKETLFQQNLRDPSNLDTAFAYADVSAKLGDNEAAVSALERMLLFNPNLPRVQLELGALYFRMGSYDIARTYFDRALAANPPEDVRQRVDTYLAEIARLAAPQRFSGYALFGLQYQSDANIAGSSSIAFPGVVVNLLPQFTKQSDYFAFATGSALYSYDLQDQAGDTFEVGGTAYINHYGTFQRLDLGIVEAAAGPRFNFHEPLPSVSTVSLKPYLIVNDVTLGGNNAFGAQYFHTLGAGGEATALAWGDLQLKSAFEFRQKWFDNAPTRPLSTGFNGSDKLVSLALSKPVTFVPDSQLSLEFDFLDQDTAFAFYTNKTYAISGAYRIRYADPTGTLKQPEETNFYLYRSWAPYAAADPCCAVTSDRYDQHWRFGIAQTLPLTSTVAIVMSVQRDIASSNVPLYHYTSDSVMVGSQIRF